MAIERNNSFHLLLSDDELKLLKLLAENEGLNASDYLRKLIRTLPTTSPQLLQGIRLGATLASKVDLAKLFETHTNAMKLALVETGKPRKKKAK